MTTIEEFEKTYENFMCWSVDIIVTHLKEGDVFLDIGANTGLFSSKIYDKVNLGNLILVEPIKPYYEECIRKFTDKKNVEFHNIGFSNENGVKKFLCSEYNLGYNKIYQDDMEIHPHFIEEIYCFRFSDWIGDRKVDFIKIDAEGHDTLIIEGMLDWLDSIEKVPYILFEGDWYEDLEEITIRTLIERYNYEVNYVGSDILMVPTSISKILN
jgi:FkbM family methyltransferase